MENSILSTNPVRQINYKLNGGAEHMANKKGKDSATSGVQDTLVPERVVDGLPTMYCFETCPFCFKVKALLGSRGIEYSKVEFCLLYTSDAADE